MCYMGVHSSRIHGWINFNTNHSEVKSGFYIADILLTYKNLEPPLSPLKRMKLISSIFGLSFSN